MPVSQRLLVIQLVGNLVGVILAIFIIMLMSINLRNFNNHCLLFSQARWIIPLSLVEIEWASKAYCGYTIAVAILMLILGCVQTYRLLPRLYGESECSLQSAILEAVGYLLLSLLTLFASFVVTFGFMNWCDSMLERYPTCQDADNEPLGDIKNANFFTDISIALVVVWLSFVTWACLAACSNRKARRIYNNLNSEREPLLNGNRRRNAIYPTIEDYH